MFRVWCRPIASQEWEAPVLRGPTPHVFQYEVALSICEERGDAQLALQFLDVSLAGDASTLGSANGCAAGGRRSFVSFRVAGVSIRHLACWAAVD